MNREMRLLCNVLFAAGSYLYRVVMAAVTAACAVTLAASLNAIAALYSSAIAALTLITFVAVFAAAHSHAGDSCDEKKFLHNRTIF